MKFTGHIPHGMAEKRGTGQRRGSSLHYCPFPFINLLSCTGKMIVDMNEDNVLIMTLCCLVPLLLMLVASETAGEEKDKEKDKERELRYYEDRKREQRRKRRRRE